jgi:hypothetical protein
MKHNRTLAIVFLTFVFQFCFAPSARCDAPGWMHNLVTAPIPPHDEKTDAVVLYSEEILNVQSADKIKHTVRRAYKILRPNGREHGVVFVSFNQHSKVIAMHGWCIPAQGKDFEVKEKDTMEISLPKIAGSELISDVKDKMFEIPAAEVGNIVGFEYEVEESPIVLQDSWDFQGSDPVKDSKYTLQLPPGWEYTVAWRNYQEVKPSQAGGNQWQWMLSDINGIRVEEKMPPWPGVAGKMIVNFYPPGGTVGNRGFKDWREMGNWYTSLAQGRRDATPEMKQKVASLAGAATTPVDKMAALAKFVQQDIRYVAIELGIGGIQPHAAGEVFQHHYGDCKDKATLMGAMLKEIGVDSYYVIINSERGSVDAKTPAQIGAFDHAIIVIKLPDGLDDPRLVSTVQHPKLGKLLFFDPTDELTPFGTLSGALQENYGLLVGPDGGELYRLPKLPAGLNGVHRTASATLDTRGNLTGSFTETRLGDSAAEERARMKTVPVDKDRVKVIEAFLSQSLANFSVTKATITSLQDTTQAFGLSYSIVVERYAKTAGDLILVRPRLIGNKGSGLLETKEIRKLPVVFDGPRHDTDEFEVTLPAGYVVDDLPPPVDLDYSFASYHSKTEAEGNVLKYTRNFEIKELSVPLDKVEELRKFYRVITGDERNTAVLKPKS